MERVPGLNWAIAKVIKEIRESRGLTQSQLAGLAGLSAVYISKLERGIKGDSVNALMQIARVLRVNFGELMGQIEAELAFEAKKPETMQGKQRQRAKPECENCRPNHSV